MPPLYVTCTPVPVTILNYLIFVGVIITLQVLGQPVQQLILLDSSASFFVGNIVNVSDSADQVIHLKSLETKERSIDYSYLFDVCYEKKLLFFADKQSRIVANELAVVSSGGHEVSYYNYFTL